MAFPLSASHGEEVAMSCVAIGLFYHHGFQRYPEATADSKSHAVCMLWWASDYGMLMCIELNLLFIFDAFFQTSFSGFRPTVTEGLERLRKRQSLRWL